MNRNSIRKFVLAHGLPGSGKTTLLTKLYNADIANDLDALFVNADGYRTPPSEAFRNAWHAAYNNKRHENRWFNWKDDYTTYVDILCTTSEFLVKTICGIVETFVRGRIFVEEDFWNKYEFVIYDFNEDRDNCLRNNELRAKINPSRSAAVTINHSKYDKIDSDTLTEQVVTTIDKELQDVPENITVTVKIKSATVFNYDEADEFEKMKSKVLTAASLCGGEIKNEKLYGKSWITGGEEWNYKGDTWRAETEDPNTFDELDKIIEAINPEMPFVTYKNIVKEVASIYEYHESDYYQSYEMSRWTCDLNKLTEAIIKYIKNC